MRTVLSFFGRWLLGALFTLTPLTAILVVGWTQRATARSVARHWHRHAGNAAKDFPDFANEQAATSDLAHWPRWIMADNAGALFAEAGRSGPLRGAGLTLRALFGSLWLNAKLGVRALIPVAVLALPAGLLFLLSWWGGWENSFNKGYEQAWVGPVAAFTGIFYFILIMTILPLAEVRQAVNNSWRAFFDISFLRRVGREARFGLLGLAMLFVTAGFIVAALKIAPLGLGNAAASPEAAERFAAIYPLLVALALFPLYLSIRLAAARVYARATMRIAAKGAREASSLGARERSLLERLSLDNPAAAPARGPLMRAAAGSSAFVVGIVCTALTLALWAGLVGEIYVSQFLAHDWLSWVNHPLVLLPWIGSIFR